MKAKIILLILLVLLCGSFVSGQNPTATPIPQQTPDYNAQQRAADQRRIEETVRRNSQEAFRRLQAIADGRNPSDIVFVREQKGVSVKYSPRLNEQDIRAISISPADLKTYAAFLKTSNTGITRLQNADVCPPSDLIVQALELLSKQRCGKGDSFFLSGERLQVTDACRCIFQSK